jgi:phosphopantothenoylcysteine decarboxylase/phosphopantothenate--cysteine ligase
MTFTNLLKGRRVLLGVTGSIAIYKSLELIRLLTKSGAEVRVVMSESAKRFITPLTFETLSRNTVLHGESENWSSDLNHIAIGKWAEVFVIAPATANTINKLSNGISDNLLLQTALAFGNRERIIALSANTNMIFNPVTEASVKMLKISGYTFVGTQKKELACQTEGDGAMADPIQIFFATARSLLKEEFWENRRVVISGGGTVEKIDEVRYISNFSSGKMASAITLSLYFRGADPCLISTRFPEELPNEICKIDIESAEEMKLYIEDSLRIAKKGIMSKPTLLDSSEVRNIQKTPYLFMASAVADYKPKFKQHGKLKSNQIGKNWNLELVENIDILEKIDKSGIVSVGFKAEMDKEKSEDYARGMLEKKNLDFVCLNILEDSGSFGTDINQIDLISRNKILKFDRANKLELALEVLKEVKI